MKKLKILVALWLGLGFPAATLAGEDNQDVGQVTGWEAVGRLTIDNRAMCTGALIAPDLVLTAAHCVYDPDNGELIRPDKIRFEAGLYGNTVRATRSVAAYAAHPGYRHRRGGRNGTGSDIAVLQLADPIDDRQIRPFAMATRPDTGDALGVISYTLSRKSTPMLQHPCDVLAHQGDVLVMNCEVDFGASGAPVFAVRAGAQPRLVSVISSKAAMGNRPVSVGTIVDGALKLMLNRS